ncbi:hypothetical protein UAA55_05320 [Nitrospirillum sp. BR 11163]|nr:hypothetical protein [Nitrospirillum sp. BR 11163]MEA1672820.1 hypothetical protein [Nitrospirillum sp. BR 11163]
MSGSALWLGGRRQPAELTIRAFVKEQGLGGMFRCQRNNQPDSDKMVAGVMDGVELAVDPGNDTVEYRQAQSRGSVLYAGKLVISRRRELPAYAFLMFAQHVNAETVPHYGFFAKLTIAGPERMRPGAGRGIRT